jgi:3-oxoacyl-[acyl-carrier protein] reductase
MDLGIGDKVALVTGGSRGIGKATAIALAKEGARVAICGRDREVLEAAGKEIAAAAGGEVLPVQADVSQLDDVKRMVSDTLRTFGRVDILVNNAASFRSAPFMELKDEDWLNHYDVKFLGAVRCVREVLPSMKENQWGRIICMGGGASRQVDIKGYSSGAVNTAMANFTKKLSDDVAPFGITANLLHPGGAMTQRRDIAFERAIRERGITREEAAREHLARIPIGRTIQSDDIAYAVLFLVSAHAGAITGQVLSVDGGTARGHYY